MRNYEKEELKSVVKHMLSQMYNDIQTNKKVTIIFILSCVYFGLVLLVNPLTFLFAFVIYIIIFPVVGISILLRIEYKEYYKSEYYKKLKRPILFTFYTAGNLGEYETSLKLEEYNSNAKLLFDLYIPKENGKTAQIDSIMINNYGIYIIESKNISGTIYGSEDDKYWTIVYTNGQKNKGYYNPVLQNKVHTNAVIKLFPNINPNLYEQYVVLSERCKIGKMNISNKYIHVVKRENLVESLLSRQDELQPKLSDNEVNMIYNELLRYTKASKKIREEHDNLFVNSIKL